MLARVDALALLGVDAYGVRVEVDVAGGLPGFQVVGLPDAAVRESSERVRSAARNSGLSFPQRRVTVNLAPADIKKQGPHFDLPMALGILLADGQISARWGEEFAAVGELGLDGAVRGVNGALPMALGARAMGKSALIVPRANAMEASVVEGLKVFPVDSLSDAVQLLGGDNREPTSTHIEEEAFAATPSDCDWSDVKGQENVKRALEVAAAGGHNCLMIGAPGSGKTLLARRFATILPPLTLAEALEVTKLYSVAGLLESGQSLVTQRPFRSPHHTVSHAGLVGGGSMPRPGEISLAHHGVLFLDELPEFHRDVLEVMRQPLEDGKVSIARAAQSLTFPSRFQLITASNPCPCGYLNDARRQCSCAPTQVRRYQSRLSGPLLDRIDLHLEVPRLSVQELMGRSQGESSSEVRERVKRARARQVERLSGEGVSCNAQMGPRLLREQCVLAPGAGDLLKSAINQLALSARAYDRILKVARTIADLDSVDEIQLHHVAEAINYRTLDRKYFGA